MPGGSCWANDALMSAPPPASCQVSPDRVAGSALVEGGLEAGRAAGSDDDVVEAGGHAPGAYLEEPVGKSRQPDAPTAGQPGLPH
jgi:hypothetical protein